MSLSPKEVLAAFDNQNEKQVPFSVWRHFNPNEHLEAKHDASIFKNDVEKEAQYVQTIDPDFIKLMDDGYFTYAYQNVEDPNDLEQLAKITEISDDHPWLKEQFDLISQQIKGVNSEQPIFSSVFSAVTLFKWSLVRELPSDQIALGDKRFADLYTKNPDVVVHALKVINNDIKKQFKVAHDAGVTGVFFSTQEIQDDRIDQEFFEKIQKPLDTELINDINKKFKLSILHICGFDGAINHLPWFVDYQLPVVNWATKVDGYTLGEGKKLFKDKVVFGGFGNTDKDVLFTGNHDQIQAAVDKLLDEAGTTGVIIGADCTVPRDTPVDHIKWANEAAHTYLTRK